MLAEIKKNPLERVSKKLNKLNSEESLVVATFIDGMIAQKGISNGNREEMDKSERAIQAGISKGDD